jgi:selenocysteine-specific elongation factor
MTQEAPLTVGTAGHIDHGKTALVRALTGVDTDRLPEEKARGITIALGYAPLLLAGGRQLSLVDVPGHERLVRVMVSGASGIDLYLLVVAADYGLMPQTFEHLRVLDALGVRDGVVAVTKADLADPAPVVRAAGELLPGVEVVPCSVRTGVGVEEVRAALGRVAERRRPRASAARGAVVLHVDRVFTIRGAGTVVTGTLWSGQLAVAQRLRLLPSDVPVRVRGLQVHDRRVERAEAGQRVAVNLVGVDRDAVGRGDVLAEPEAPVRSVFRIEAALELHEPLTSGDRVQVHHGTRDAPARAYARGDGVWQLRAARPLIVAPGDRLVVRRISPPGTLGGGEIVRAGAPAQTAETRTRLDPAPPHRPPAGGPAPLEPAAVALAERLLAAGLEPYDEADLGEDARWLPALREAGLAVRVGRSMYAHPDALDRLRETVSRLIAAEGAVTLARLRDELGTSRKYAQALLEHLDAARFTRRLPDDRRVLRRGAGG